MRRTLVIMAVFGLFALGAVVGATSVGAQDNPPLPIVITADCTDADFDLDGNGIVTGEDLSWWKSVAAACIDPETEQFIETNDCIAVLGGQFGAADVNNDGHVNFDDYGAMAARTQSCFRAGIIIDLPGIPR